MKKLLILLSLCIIGNTYGSTAAPAHKKAKQKGVSTPYPQNSASPSVVDFKQLGGRPSSPAFSRPHSPYKSPKKQPRSIAVRGKGFQPFHHANNEPIKVTHIKKDDAFVAPKIDKENTPPA